MIESPDVAATSEETKKALLWVANRAIADARVEWRANDGSVSGLRAAHRACVLAARCARSAAAAWADSEDISKKLSDAADNIELEIEQLLPKLASRAVAGVLAPE